MGRADGRQETTMKAKQDAGLVRSLAGGALDVIGDVHGEIEALDALLGELGYDGDARHPDGRTLVFVGDLCDRGPDSIAVMGRVQRWIAAGRAQCVLGNHELNLLRLDHKDGNGWFFTGQPHQDDGNPRYRGCRAATPAEQADMLAFLDTLPLVLERKDLTVVHACPDGDALTAARAAVAVSALDFDRQQKRQLDAQLAALDARPDVQAERTRYRRFETDRTASPEVLPALAARDALNQNGNAARVLTSGLEQPTASPFFSSGKWRLLDRQRWWERWDAPQAVIFGHYWRTPDGMAQPAHKGIHGLFAGSGDCDWSGPAGTAYCVDHCVGARCAEREQGVSTGFAGRLSALRWPEAELVMDDGRRVMTGFRAVSRPR